MMSYKRNNKMLHKAMLMAAMVTVAIGSAHGRTANINLGDDQNAHQVDGRFLGFSAEYFEGAQGLVAPQATGAYALQLIHNLNAITGRPVQVRVGGHSADLVAYSREKLEPLFRQLRAGADELEAMAARGGNVLADSAPPVQFVINVGYRDPKNTAEIADWMSLSRQYLSPANVPSRLKKRQDGGRNYLAAFEIANEPEFYRGNERPTSYGPDVFRREFAQTLQELASNQQWINGSFASGAFQCGTVTPYWLPHSERFLNDFGAHCGSFSLHDYTIGRKTANDTDYNKYDLLAAPIGEFFDKLRPQIATAKRLMRGDQYRIGEGNSVNAGGIAGCKFFVFFCIVVHEAHGILVSDIFAATLWAVRYMLEAAAAGVDGINFHGGGKSLP